MYDLLRGSGREWPKNLGRQSTPVPNTRFSARRSESGESESGESESGESERHTKEQRIERPSGLLSGAPTVVARVVVMTRLVKRDDCVNPAPHRRD